MTYLIVLFAISIAFWTLGSPAGSNLCRSEIALRTSGGFPKSLKSPYQPPSSSDKAYDWNYSQTRHFTDPLPNSRSHAHDPDLAERILVEPFVHKLTCVRETEVKPGRAHVSVHH